MFYVLIFGLLALVLIGVGVTTMSRRRRSLDRQSGQTTHNSASRHNRKAKRVQSRHDRRKRH